MSTPNTPLESPRVLTVTREQFERIEDAWYLASFPGKRRIRDADVIAWFDWAVYTVTGIDVRGESFTLEIANV